MRDAHLHDAVTAIENLCARVAALECLAAALTLNRQPGMALKEALARTDTAQREGTELAAKLRRLPTIAEMPAVRSDTLPSTPEPSRVGTYSYRSVP